MRQGLFLYFLVFSLLVSAYRSKVYDENIHTLQVLVDDNPLLPPILKKEARQHVTVSWDEFSHDYHRYIYHVQHCDVDWQPTEGLFESDYLGGLNDQPIEDYEKSFNTLQLYTHYAVRFPNENTSLLLSGNYRVLIYEDGESIDDPILEARFSVVESIASVRMEVSGNTDIDFNKTNQQVTLGMSYGGLNVVDPQREITTFVFKNREWESGRKLRDANIRRANGQEFTHDRQLIFAAGSEFHKFEILDVHRTSMGVDKMEWFEPYYHATLFADKPLHNYSYDEDQNGVYVLRSSDDESDDTTAEYVWVHFVLKSPLLRDGDVYVCGNWTTAAYEPSCKMEYNEDMGEYEVALYLKQGYYSYQYRLDDGSTGRTMGDFFQTENEYLTLVYYRGQGTRYDRLVGYSKVNSGKK